MAQLTNFSHQRDLFDPRTAKKTVVIGAGSVGSLAVFHLAKKGVSDIEVWDDDSVASHNLPTSLYALGDVGRFKVEALREHVERLTGVRIEARQQKYAGEKLRNVTVVACVDTMQARRLIWKAVRMNPTIHLLCDSRTGGFYYEVYSVNPCMPQDMEQYEASLHDDAEAPLIECGRHGIIETSSRASSVISASVTRFWGTGKKRLLIAERSDSIEHVL